MEHMRKQHKLGRRAVLAYMVARVKALPKAELLRSSPNPKPRSLKRKIPVLFLNYLYFKLHDKSK